MDEDLAAMGREELESEVRKLRDGIREDSRRTGHDLCWHRPELWSLVPGYVKPEPEVPHRREFLERCAQYRDTFDTPVPAGPMLVGVMGMCEMESAVARIIEKRERFGIDLLCRVTVTYEDMRHRGEREGFLNILAGDWLEPNLINYACKSEFFANRRLCERLKEKLGDHPWLRWVPQMPQLQAVEMSMQSELDYTSVNEGCRIVRRHEPGAPLGKGDDVFYLQCSAGVLKAMTPEETEEMARLGWTWSEDSSWVTDEYPSGGKWTLRSPELVRGYYN